ncbi:hypothetical protein CLOP_g4756 [Closterium sp. NIES-67]|nr:hypothetical protein CLOP_g4756 [Closterium sp. NIES-67]
MEGTCWYCKKVGHPWFKCFSRLEGWAPPGMKPPSGPAKTPLALVHMDVVGPTRAPSLSGSRYFLTIVDDHTRAVWVYPLNSKGEVAAAVLKEWMPRAQRECGHKVEVAVSEEEMSGVTEEGGAAEVEQQQQHESPPRVPHPPERPRRDVRPPGQMSKLGFL